MNSINLILHRLYHRVLELSAHKHAVWFLALIALIESIFFPIPPDILLIPLILAQPKRAFYFAFITTLASVIGGSIGYLLGYGFYSLIAQPIIELYGSINIIDQISAAYEQHGWWIVLGAGFTPVPYKLVTIGSGVLGFPFLGFIVFSILGRGARFFLLATLLFFAGDPLKQFIEKYFALLTLAMFLLLIGGFSLIFILLS